MKLIDLLKEIDFSDYIEPHIEDDIKDLEDKKLYKYYISKLKEIENNKNWYWFKAIVKNVIKNKRKLALVRLQDLDKKFSSIKDNLFKDEEAFFVSRNDKKPFLGDF